MRHRFRGSLPHLVALASLVACGESSGPTGSLTITGSYLLSTANGTPVPVEVFASGRSARIESGAPFWEVDRGAGTATSDGNTVRFSDSGDGAGPFTGTVNGDRLTFVDGGVTLVFVRGVVIDEITVTPAQADLTACVPLRLVAAALNTGSGSVPNATIAWQ